MSAALVGRRDCELLRALYEEYAHPLWSYVVGLNGGDPGGAEDVVQETLLRAWLNKAVLEQVDGSRRGWLWTVAKHIVIDEWRAARRRPAMVTGHVPEQPVVDTEPRTVDRQVMLTALRTLSIEHRQVLFEVYFRDASVSDAAATLGVPPGTIKSRTHYALRALRQAIGDTGRIA